MGGLQVRHCKLKRKLYAVLVPGIILVFASCASTPTVQPETEPVFYPPPPDPPRIQFLTSFSDSRDVTGKESVFKKFIVGEEEANSIVKPYGFDVWENTIVICDTQMQALDIIDLEEKTFIYFMPTGKGRLQKPVNISIAENGTKYIADTGINAVLVFDADDNYLRTISKEGGWKPTDVAIGTDKLFISDLQNNSVTVWNTETEELLYSIPRDESEEARLFSPINIALGPNGDLFVSDMGASRIQRYDTEGGFLGSIGSYGDGLGQFARPKGIDLDESGRLYVVDAAFQLVQIFDEEGNLLMFFGEPRDDAFILDLPAKVKTNRTLIPYFQKYADPSFEIEYIIFVASQYGEHKLSVFGFGKQKE